VEAGAQQQNPVVPAAPEQAFDFEEQLPRQEYLELRKAYIEGEQQAYQSFDSALITLSSAILGLSVTFTQAFVQNPQGTRLLFSGWTCLIGTLILTLTSFLTSQSAFRAQRENLDRMYRGESERKSAWDGVTAALNILCAVLFVTGIILIVLFGYNNLK
jgi:uncharacterized BrkB/YihY/UPF0761 family membrane protein